MVADDPTGEQESIDIVPVAVDGSLADAARRGVWDEAGYFTLCQWIEEAGNAQDRLIAEVRAARRLLTDLFEYLAFSGATTHVQVGDRLWAKHEAVYDAEWALKARQRLFWHLSRFSPAAIRPEIRCSDPNEEVCRLRAYDSLATFLRGLRSPDEGSETPENRP